MRKAINSGAARFLVPLALAFVVASTFSPLRRAGVTNLDDVNTLLNNQNLRGWSIDHLKKMGFSIGFGFGGDDRAEAWRSGVYQPVSWLTHAVDFSIWRQDFTGHHITSIMFHCASAVLAYILILLLLQLGAPTTAVWSMRAAAAFGAAAWALQPLRVQPVGWLSTRSYLVPTFFALLSAIAYLKAHSGIAERRSRLRWLGLSWLALVLSLLSKSFGLTLPLSFLILDIWPLRRLHEGESRAKASARLIAEKLPFFAAAFYLFEVSLSGRRGTTQGLGLTHILRSMVTAPRLSQFVFETTYFVEKTILPFRIISINEHPGFWHPLDPFFGMRTLALIAMTVAAMAAWRRWSAALICWLCYLVTLAPLSGLVLYDNANQVSQDKYGYLPSVWLGVLAAFAAVEMLRAARSGVWRLWVARAALAAVVAGLIAATYAQATLWADQERWWQYNMAVEPDCYLCRITLGIDWRARPDRLDDAVTLMIQLADLWPDEASVEGSVPGTITGAISAMPEPQKTRALARIREAFSDRPRTAGLHYALAVWHDSEGRSADALQQMALAIRYAPMDSRSHLSFAQLLERAGRHDEALAQARLAAKDAGTDARMRFESGMFLGGRGLVDEAIAQLLLAIRADPTFWPAHFDLGIYYGDQKRFALAAEQTEAALKLDPDNPQAHHNLGFFYIQLGRLTAARGEFQAALRLDPKAENTRHNLVYVEGLLAQRAKKR